MLRFRVVWFLGFRVWGFRVWGFEGCLGCWGVGYFWGGMGGCPQPTFLTLLTESEKGASKSKARRAARWSCSRDPGFLGFQGVRV